MHLARRTPAPGVQGEQRATTTALPGSVVVPIAAESLRLGRPSATVISGRPTVRAPLGQLQQKSHKPGVQTMDEVRPNPMLARTACSVPHRLSVDNRKRACRLPAERSTHPFGRHLPGAMRCNS